ncbi:hypothetical protein LC087_08370 [Bacillus carboniphilus]|uniref:Uncharacterized protein n=1 Tax=Bacillus carboniphilus TaxID=86663 RepID=A0ABY9JXM4_9BACI|nr:hypothetical protein [Bacillus carboniphilus]WLR44095.1 hypothetical protein LC087_08370 [Bacillus carboniphilus]
MKVVTRGVFTIIMLMLFGWQLIYFYNANIDIVHFIKNDSTDSFMFEINMIPTLLLILTVAGYYFFIKDARKNFFRIKPDEFEEKDEREKQITSQACRTSYVSMMYASPIICGLFVFYPFISDLIPYYPILVFLLLPLTQIITYLISWRRSYLN